MPRLIALWALLLCLLAPSARASDLPHVGAGPLYDRFTQLWSLTLDPSRSLAASGQTLGRDRGRFTFKEGQFVPFLYGDGKMAGLVFIGKGRFEYTPPDEREAYALELRTLERTLNKDFTRCYMHFSDTTLEELSPDGIWGGPPADPAPFKRLFEDRVEAWNTVKWESGSPPIEFERILGELHPVWGFEGWFVGEFDPIDLGRNARMSLEKPFEWLTWYVNPHGASLEEEEVSLFGHRLPSVASTDQEMDIFQSFHRMEDLERLSLAELANKSSELIEVSHNKLNLKVLKPATRLGDLKTVELSATLTVTALGQQPVKAASFDFLRRIRRDASTVSNVEVKAVSGPGGAPASWVHARNVMLVSFDPPIPPGQTRELTFTWTADYLRAMDKGAYTLLNTWPWYPQTPGFDHFTLDWQVCVPSGFMAAGTGSRTRVWEEDGYRCEQWVEKENVVIPSVIVGKYDLRELPVKPGQPVIRGYALPADGGFDVPADAAAFLPDAAMTSQGSALKVMQDLMGQLANIIELYVSFYGPWPFEELDFVQMSRWFGFGQAPPGLVQVAGGSMDSVGYTSNMDAFFAHEMAHQYWGHQVGWKTYHDQWLSEAFAEYTSGVYLNLLMGEERFMEQLKEWRERTLQFDQYGPISMGYRLGRGYTAMTYNKGPYLLHMLRNLLGTQPFFEALKLTCQVADHRNMSTEDFIALLNKYTGQDLRWFFDQWFFGMDIPTLEGTWTVAQRDGKWVVSGQIKQTDTKMRLPLPIYIKFGRKDGVKQIVWMMNDTLDFEIPGIPKEPTEVELDPFGEVLTRKVTFKKG